MFLYLSPFSSHTWTTVDLTPSLYLTLTHTPRHPSPSQSLTLWLASIYTLSSNPSSHKHVKPPSPFSRSVSHPFTPPPPLPHTLSALSVSQSLTLQLTHIYNLSALSVSQSLTLQLTHIYTLSALFVSQSLTLQLTHIYTLSAMSVSQSLTLQLTHIYTLSALSLSL